jgi:multidrug efflux pump subunit AcrA (membrane-fusion protein)
MADLASVRAEIERARKLVDRQRRDILALRRAGISMADAELVLARRLAPLDDLIGERNRLMSARPGPTEGKVLGGRKW